MTRATCNTSGAEHVWAEEFSQFSRAEVTAEVAESGTYKQDFWRKLEDEWKEIAKEETHPWLADFNSSSYDPFKEYK